MTIVQIKCSYCRKGFVRKIRYINEAKKYGWKQFCSKKCLANSRKKQFRLICNNPICKKVFYRCRAETVRVKHNFCSQSCAAIFFNKKRIAKRTIKCSNPSCQNLVLPGNKYCSNKCQGKLRRKSIMQSRNELINRIRNFAEIHHRIPVKREMYGAYRKARKTFGTWNNAIRAAGFKPNPVLFANKFVAKDGHKCNSLAEKIIDDWFYKNKLTHKTNVPYPGNNKFTCDFVIKNLYIEFFGLKGVNEKYTEICKKKERLCKENRLKLIKLYPKHLFPKCRLNKIFQNLINN